MVRCSRRRLLRGIAALVGVGGGCAGRSGPTPRSDTPTASERTFPNRESSPATRTVRHPTGKTAVRSAVVTPETERDEWIPTEWLVTTPEGREGLSFASGATGVDAAQRFVAGTDLSTATLFVQQYGTPECETRRLKRHRWDRTSVAVDYETVDRDVDCRVDAPFDVEATLVRTPGVIDRLDYLRSSVS